MLGVLCLCLCVCGPETRQTLRNGIKAINYVEISSMLTDVYCLQHLL